MKKLLLTLITLSATANVYAGPSKMKEALDTDGDGVISRSEIAAAKAARFKAIDSNGDGKLSLDELSSHAQERHSKRKEKQQDKRSQRQAKRFEKLDADANGAVNLAEFIERTPRGEEQVLKNIFKVMDQDANDELSLEELQNAKNQRSAMMFAKLDKNGDGQVSEQEFSQMKLGKRSAKRGERQHLPH